MPSYLKDSEEVRSLMDRLKHVEKLEPEAGCIFCELRLNHPDAVMYSDEDFYVTRDIAPRAPDHYLIISKKHVATWEEDYELAKRAIELALSFGGSRRVVLNIGRPQQEVMHVHAHVMGDSVSLPA